MQGGYIGVAVASIVGNDEELSVGFHLLYVEDFVYLVRGEHIGVENVTANRSKPGVSALRICH